MSRMKQPQQMPRERVSQDVTSAAPGRRRSRIAEAVLTVKVKAKIVAMLNAEQKEKYQETLKRLSRKNGAKKRPSKEAPKQQPAI